MFRLYFLKVKGMPPMKYKTQLRLEKARDLLSSKEYSVKEVSYIVGYSDVSYFSRIFKKEYGYPPVELLN
jgi:AraC-like DNA-binding protein